MNPIFALQPLRKSIFLAGPTPRPPKPGRPAVKSWRPEALEILERLGFDGDVFVPETPTWDQHDNYDRQVLWEWEALSQATVVAFWLPREILDVQDGKIIGLKMPALTSNVEFGLVVASGRLMLGYPDFAEKVSYPAALARKYNAPVHHHVDLETFLKAAVERTRSLYADI